MRSLIAIVNPYKIAYHHLAVIAGRQIHLKACGVSVEEQSVLIHHKNLQLAASLVSDVKTTIQYTPHLEANSLSV